MEVICQKYECNNRKLNNYINSLNYNQMCTLHTSMFGAKLVSHRTN